MTMKQLLQALADGKTIKSGNWKVEASDTGLRSFYKDEKEYRADRWRFLEPEKWSIYTEPESIDPYAEFKQAIKDGKQIEIKIGEHWINPPLNSNVLLYWNLEPNRYRIKKEPETIREQIIKNDLKLDSTNEDGIKVYKVKSVFDNESEFNSALDYLKDLTGTIQDLTKDQNDLDLQNYIRKMIKEINNIHEEELEKEKESITFWEKVTLPNKEKEEPVYYWQLERLEYNKVRISHTQNYYNDSKCKDFEDGGWTRIESSKRLAPK